MILLLRGHIRNSFDDESLYNLIKDIHKLNTDIEIYIHTWSIVQNSISWLHLDTNSTEVTEKYICDYFRDLSPFIKKIIIDDDSNIQYVGNTSGNINCGCAPIIGWKNYWFGQYRAINYIDEQIKNKETVIVNLRFDILKNRCECNNIEQNKILEFIGQYCYCEFTKNVFIVKEWNTGLGKFLGIDNVYIGNIKTQRELINHFHNNLDNILATNDPTIHQELLVYWENDKIF